MVGARHVGQGVAGDAGEHVVEIGAEIIGLRRARRSHHLQAVRLLIIDRHAAGGEGALIAVGAVHFQEIAAGDGRGVRLLRLEHVNVHAVAVALHLFLEDIDAVVIAHAGAGGGGVGGDGAGAVVKEDLHEPGARGIMAEVASELVQQTVVHQREVKLVWRIKHPVGFRREARERRLVVLVELVQKFHREARFGKPLRAGAPQIDPRTLHRLRAVHDRDLPRGRVVVHDRDHDHVVHGRKAAGETRARHGVDDDNGQGGDEVRDAAGNLKITFGARRAGEARGRGREGAGAHLERAADRDGPGVEQRGRRGNVRGAVHVLRGGDEVVADEAVRVRRAQGQQESVGIGAAAARELHVQRGVGTGAVMRARRGHDEVAGDARVHAVAPVGDVLQLRIRIGGRKLRDDVGVWVHEGEVFAAGGESEIAVQLRQIVRAVLARGEDHEVAVAHEGRAIRDAPLGQVVHAVREEPAADVRGRTAGIVNFNPVRGVAVLVAQRVRAVAIVHGEKFRNDEDRGRRVRVQSVGPEVRGEGVVCPVEDARQGRKRDAHRARRRLGEFKRVDRGRDGQHVCGGRAVDQQIAGVHAGHGFGEIHLNRSERRHRRAGHRRLPADHGRHIVHGHAERRVQHQVAARVVRVEEHDGDDVRPLDQRAGEVVHHGIAEGQRLQRGR